MKDKDFRECIRRHDLFGEQEYCASCTLNQDCLKVRFQMQKDKEKHRSNCFTPN